jgi:RNA polymerase sigma-70 factor (ECF subfamily)
MSYPTPGAADDAALLVRYARSGDASAFAELVGRYADFVYATARRVTGSGAAAEDVAQDCFLRLAQRAAEIHGSVAALLHRTTVNRSLEYRRSELARKRREAQTTPQPDDADAESALLVTMVDTALAQLPEDLRVAVTEHYLAGRSQVELAAALGVSQPTISRRIEKGLNALRERLRRDGAVPAVGVLALWFARLPKTIAPASVKAAATKIGLSGVGSASASASAAGSTVLLNTAVVAGTLVCAIAAMLYLRSPSTSAPPTKATAAVSASKPSVIRAVLADDDDDDGPDDDDDDNRAKATKPVASGVTVAPATRRSR